MAEYKRYGLRQYFKMKIKTISILLLLLFTDFTYAQDSIRVVKVISVYDGDTFRVDLDCDCEIFCKNISIRVAGIDTPEIKGKCKEEKELAIRAREFTKQFLQQGTIILKNIKRGKYFRVVANVYVNEESLSLQLITYNLGVEYGGRKKFEEWCLYTH